MHQRALPLWGSSPVTHCLPAMLIGRQWACGGGGVIPPLRVRIVSLTFVLCARSFFLSFLFNRGLEQHWLLKDLLADLNPRHKRPGKAHSESKVTNVKGTTQAHHKPTPPALPAPHHKNRETRARSKAGEGGGEINGRGGVAGRRLATDVTPVLLKCNRQWDLNSGFEAQGRPDFDPVSPLRGQASIKFTGGREKMGGAGRRGGV